MKKAVIGFIIAIMCVAFGQEDAGSTVTKVIRQDIKLSLTFPSYPLLYVEYEVPCLLRVTNTGNTPLPFHVYDTIGSQLKFDLGKSGYTPPYSTPNVTNTQPWKLVSQIADIAIRPGESYDLDLTRQFFPFQEACAMVGATNITAYLLVGENEWAKSEPYPIQVRGQNMDDRYWMKPPVFIAKKGNRHIMDFFSHTIDERKWLFDGRRVRIGELFGDEKPEFHFDEETGIISISQRNRKQIRYDVLKRKVIENQGEKP